MCVYIYIYIYIYNIYIILKFNATKVLNVHKLNEKFSYKYFDVFTKSSSVYTL